jgi:hypothetical protein
MLRLKQSRIKIGNRQLKEDSEHRHKLQEMIKPCLVVREYVAKSNDFHYNILDFGYAKGIFRRNIGDTGVIKKAACKREDTMTDCGKMGMDCEVIVTKSRIYLFHKVFRRWWDDWTGDRHSIEIPLFGKK